MAMRPGHAGPRVTTRFREGGVAAIAASVLEDVRARAQSCRVGETEARLAGVWAHLAGHRRVREIQETEKR